ncbi:MAG: MFS transporter [Acidobacteriota bacterium]
MPTSEQTPSASPSRSSFAEPRFRWLFASNTTFFLGMGGQQVLRAWLVFQITGSELALGLVSAVVAVPMLLVAPIGGAVADRVDRRQLVAGGQAMIVVAEIATLGLLLAGRLEFWHLLLLAAVMGAAFPFIMPARQAIVADVVGRERLTNAMAVNMAAVNTTRVLGPAAAGFLIGGIGLERAYALNVGLYLTALLFMIGVGAAPAAPEARELSITSNMVEGFQYVRGNRLVLILLFFGLLPPFLMMPFQSLLVVFAEDIWQVGAQGLGLLSAAAGVGGVLGAVLVALRRTSPERLRLMMVSIFGFGGCLFFFAKSPWFLPALVAVFVANVFAALYGTLNNTSIQELIPDAVRGRVSSFLMMSFSLPLFGTLPISAVAELYGAPNAVALASIMAVVICLAFYAASPSLRQMDARLREAMNR